AGDVRGGLRGSAHAAGAPPLALGAGHHRRADRRGPALGAGVAQRPGLVPADGPVLHAVGGPDGGVAGHPRSLPHRLRAGRQDLAPPPAPPRGVGGPGAVGGLRPVPGLPRGRLHPRALRRVVGLGRGGRPVRGLPRAALRDLRLSPLPAHHHGAALPRLRRARRGGRAVTVALVLVFLLALGVPLFVVIGVAAAVAFGVYAGQGGVEGLQVLIVKMVSLTTKNVFLAIPFFVISGAVMSAGSIATRLVTLAETLVGGMRGGLAVAAILASVIFAAISGSSPVTLIAIGGIMFPAMLRAGYREPFALGLVTTAGSLGCLIPPSIPMLVYAISVTGTSAVDVRELFMAGIGAALIVSLMLAGYAVLRAGPVAAGTSFSFARLRVALREGIWALALPVVVLGGIYGGLFTPTEASAVSVVYAVLVEVVIHRSLTWRQIPQVVTKSAASLGGLLVVIALSLAINDFLVEQ